VKLLLDTHALIWWVSDDARLSNTVRLLLNSPDAEAFVSSASAWEIATKIRSGKWQLDEATWNNLPSVLTKSGFRELPITITHGYRAGSLPGRHKDPFDRMLAAQSLCEELPLVTVDEKIKSFGVVSVW
jgi:PIN domain nuclease of toxin-antitoxin system